MLPMPSLFLSLFPTVFTFVDYSPFFPRFEILIRRESKRSSRKYGALLVRLFNRGALRDRCYMFSIACCIIGMKVVPFEFPLIEWFK